MVQTWVRRIRHGDVETRKLPGAAVAAGRPGKVGIAVAGTAALRPWNLPGLTDHPDLLTCAAEQRAWKERRQQLRMQVSALTPGCGLTSENLVLGISYEREHALSVFLGLSPAKVIILNFFTAESYSIVYITILSLSI